MKKHKAFISLFLALAITFSMLAGCSGKEGLSDLLNPEETLSSPEEPGTSEPNGSNDPNGSDGLSGYSPETYMDAFDDKGFFKGVRALDYIEMFKYSGIQIPSDVHLITDEDVQAQIDTIISNFPVTNQITDREVEDGDLVNIDYVGSVGGVEFEGGNTFGSGTDVTAGSMDYVDDFLVQIIGHMPGETIDVKVTFPDDYGSPEYGNEDLNGQDALFVTTINYIAEMQDAELTDSFVVENLSEYYGWTTVDEMKQGLHSDMQSYNIQQYIREYFVNEVTVNTIPDQIIDYQINSMLNYFQGYADYYGIGIDELLSGEGFDSVDDLINQQYESIMQSAVFLLVLLAVAEDAGMTVSDNDVDDYFLKNDMTSDYARIVEEYGMPFVRHNVLYQMVIDFVTDNAVFQ